VFPLTVPLGELSIASKNYTQKEHHIYPGQPFMLINQANGAVQLACRNPEVMRCSAELMQCR
jgi:hypothetical protein